MAPLRRARPLPSRVAARRRCATTAPESKAIEPPSRAQLWRLALNVGVPFVGFGFADNLIMILAGDAIDKSIGVTLGISTLAAAGLGNLLSDVVGIGARPCLVSRRIGVALHVEHERHRRTGAALHVEHERHLVRSDDVRGLLVGPLR